jgi:hypothetical protein
MSKALKRYSCGAGDGMIENRKGDYVTYSEHEKQLEEETQKLKEVIEMLLISKDKLKEVSGVALKPETLGQLDAYFIATGLGEVAKENYMRLNKNYPRICIVPMVKEAMDLNTF